jgi:hypothetical protein
MTTSGSVVHTICLKTLQVLRNPVHNVRGLFDRIGPKKRKWSNMNDLGAGTNGGKENGVHSDHGGQPAQVLENHVAKTDGDLPLERKSPSTPRDVAKNVLSLCEYAILLLNQFGHEYFFIILCA